MTQAKKRLGELLLEEGLIDRFQLQAALAEQKKWGGRLGKHLIELGILSEEVLVKVLSKLLAIPSVDVGRLQIPRAVIDYVPLKTVEKFTLMPIGIEEAAGGKRTIIVAMADPTNLAALDELRFTTGCNVRAVVSGDSSIERAIRTYYKGGVEAPQQQGTRRQAPSEDGGEIVIMRGGVPETIRMDGGAVAGKIPQSASRDVASLPPNALMPVGDNVEDANRKLNALLRVLVRRKLITEEELLAELAKG